MNHFNNYHYIYKDSQGTWDEATNPVFIAKHTNCRAIDKALVKDIKTYLQLKNKG